MTDFNSESKGAFYPKVSIVIPVFNGSDYLNEAIDSALAQTYKNIEIIVVNDGSSDEGKTEKMALAYGDKIRYLNKENGGVASALNLGIEEMNGEYFSWLSHDDLFYPKKTKIQVDELSKLSNKEVFVFSDFEFIDDKRQHINYFKVCEEFRDKFGLCIIFNQIHGCTVLIHKNILRAINGFDSRFQTTQDYNAWVNIFKMRFPSVHIQNVLVKSRIHNNQGTKTMKEISKSEILNIEKKYISEIAIYYPSYLNKIRLHYKAINYELHYLFLKFLLKSDYSLPTKLRVIFWIILIKLKIISSSIKRKNILKELSTKAYEKNLWGDSQSRSGPGSNLENTKEIRVKIPELIKKYKIRTIVDAPCGDFFWMKEILEESITAIDLYTGIDIVEEIVQNNEKKYTSDKISFKKSDLTRDIVPKADLIICRDLILHLSYRDIFKILKNFKKSGSNYLLISTYWRHKNKNVYNFSITGRAVNLEKSPFKIRNNSDLINENFHGQNQEYSDKSLILIKIDSLNINLMHQRILMNELLFIPRYFILRLSRKMFHVIRSMVKNV